MVRKILYRKIIIAAFLLLPLPLLFGGENDLFRLVESYYKNGNYYNAITEAKRYRYLYPKGKYFVNSTLLLGKSYFKGKNYSMGARVMAGLHEKNRNSPAGEVALTWLIQMRILQGFPLFALSKINEYRSSYGEGENREKVEYSNCYAVALTYSFHSTVQQIENFRNRYPISSYSDELNELETIVREEMGRPRKSLSFAVLGSLIIPGFGYFYTGKYFTGLVTFLSNALFGFLIYNGIRQDDTFQIIFFSLVELSFYQYSLYGAMRSVREYNSMEHYNRRVRLSFGTSF